MTSAVHHNTRQRDLDRLVTRAARVLLRWQFINEIRLAAASALMWLFVGPLLLLIATYFDWPALNPWMLAGSALLGPVLYVLYRLTRALCGYRPARHTALALFDAQLEARDRLVAADEFLHESDAGSGFKQAAVMDADNYVRQAFSTSLTPRAVADWHLKSISVVGVLAAMLIAAVLVFQVIPSQPGSLRHGSPSSLAGVEHIEDKKTTQHAVAPRRVADVRDRQRENEVGQGLSQPQTESTQRPEQAARSAQGQSASTSTAAAQSANSSNSSSGQPSSQKNSTPSKPRDTVVASAQNKSTPAAQRGDRKQQENQLALEPTSGEGSSSSSASSTSPFELPERADKNDLAIKQDDPAAEAEETDEQEKSNSMNTPSVSDRKAPADRNASARPTGNSVPTDANGRGGPGGLKKTRGVPSMILGIPVADRVQGMPNPGSAKVTRERAKPSVETPAATSAEQRLARTDLTGEIPHPPLLPWMQSVIRDYFLAAHGQALPDAAPPLTNPTLPTKDN